MKAIIFTLKDIFPYFNNLKLLHFICKMYPLLKIKVKNSANRQPSFFQKLRMGISTFITYITFKFPNPGGKRKKKQIYCESVNIPPIPTCQKKHTHKPIIRNLLDSEPINSMSECSLLSSIQT